MTAPGNTVLIVTLLAAFLACSGYAAGRLHQRRQTGRDREEAYRDGYENATRSVFSLAARIIGPRRASARGSAEVKPAADTGATTALPPLAPPGGPAVPRPLSSAAPPAAFRASSPAAPPAMSPASSSAGSAPSSAGPPVSPASVVAGVPGPASLGSVADPGFPVPPPPPPSVLAEPAAVGGVTYQPFPDPRLAEHPRPEDPANSPSPSPSSGPSPSPSSGPSPSPSSGPSPSPTAAARASAAAKDQRARRRTGHRAADDGPGVAEQAEPGNEAPGSAGRHTVPDELVRATTYRLPPDRVFRAKVRETPGSPGLPDESTTRLVPKPRES